MSARDARVPSSIRSWNGTIGKLHHEAVLLPDGPFIVGHLCITGPLFRIAVDVAEPEAALLEEIVGEGPGEEYGISGPRGQVDGRTNERAPHALPLKLRPDGERHQFDQRRRIVIEAHASEDVPVLIAHDAIVVDVVRYPRLAARQRESLRRELIIQLRQGSHVGVVRRFNPQGRGQRAGGRVYAEVPSHESRVTFSSNSLAFVPSVSALSSSRFAA